MEKVRLIDHRVYLKDGLWIIEEDEKIREIEKKRPDIRKEAHGNTMAYGILQKHNISGDEEQLKIRFDAIASHDITYVSIIQTARASGMTEFPLPFVLTNCHNSLCAVGGTINEDDHQFGLSAAQKYGGIYVPANLAVIHQYMREMMAGCGKMILSTDSHTRYGALGTVAMGEGGGELVKQLLCATYDIHYPDIVGVYLTGKPIPGVGPQDVALAIIGAVYKKDFVKNKILEFVGPGIANLSAEFRIGVDVMMTESACLSTIWQTDEETREYLENHKRGQEYKKLEPGEMALYDRMMILDLSQIRPMIALPFHPSNAVEIEEFNANTEDILYGIEKDFIHATGDETFRLTDKVENGRLKADQGIICGCAGGTYSNIMAATHIIKKAGADLTNFNFSVYPSSQPVYLDLMKKQALYDLAECGVTIKQCFCGPCFGIGDTPANHGFSIRHVTRNFVTREGSRPEQGQSAAVALMDARSIAATAVNGGRLTPATDFADDYEIPAHEYCFEPYEKKVYQGWGKANPEKNLVYGPNITDWPEFAPLADHVLLKVCAKFDDPITTTDDLLPSGEASSYRSNPLYLANFALSRRKPEYGKKAREVQKMKEIPVQLLEQIHQISGLEGISSENTGIGSCITGNKMGDGSAREQAVSSQRVLGGMANIAKEYATKRYGSNLMNWGLLPLLWEKADILEEEDWILLPNIRETLKERKSEIRLVILGTKVVEETCSILELGQREMEIILAGGLINYYRHQN